MFFLWHPVCQKNKQNRRSCRLSHAVQKSIIKNPLKIINNHIKFFATQKNIYQPISVAKQRFKGKIRKKGEKMQNIIQKHKEDTGTTYSQMAEDINKISEEFGEEPALSKRSLIGYANGKNIPERADVVAAMAEYFGVTSAHLLRNLRECKQ